ncbi:ATP-binding protein [Comamonas testosteroni]|uniref:ATP-binding protein n=1 Tax=Comamonas testosteroni TaxID=285 RepID=UPI0012D2D831|nr:ATP-binding protein [Comamonas testosteroni]
MNTSFTEFHNSLSYKCVCFDGSLNELISRTPLENRESYRPANDIPVYARTMDSHKYVQYLRPIANRFFGQIDAEATELMTNCYVSDVNYDSAYKSAQVLLVDSVTPYLEEYGVKDTKNDENGGGFGNRIKRNIIKEPKADVVVLFGGKGIGKSTFLRRLLYVNPPQVIKKNAVIALIDLLEIPEDKKLIDEHIWKELIRNMDIDNLLSGRRDQLVELFSDRYKTAIKQELFGFDETSADFNKTLNALIGLWKEDYKYVTKRLSIYLRGKHKGVVVVLDNTDQYRGLQEYCFTHAQQIAKALNCLVIISMREERFYASTIRGVLDAFQNSGFHLSSPSPQNVFLKRIDFVQRLISNTARRYDIVPEDMPLDDIETMQKFLRNLSNEFRLEQSHLSGFLSACAHGNIRLALELFRGLIQSRYTNIDEITSKKDWKWQIHQVLKPIMIPNRFFYEESQSHIPNIFQIRSKKDLLILQL